MKWVADELQHGAEVTFRPRGKSMEPLVKDRQGVTVAPCGDREIKKGDIVLCKVKGKYYLHKVLAVGDRGYLIGNNKGHTNGWTRQVFGYLKEKLDD